MLLAIDTSAGVSVAAGDGDRIAEQQESRTTVHAEVLAGLVRAVLTELGGSVRDVSRIVVGTGPAPFTGLRVGLITARTLADALGVPVEGVCSLDVLAAQVAAADATTPTEFRIAADARRREVYWAAYRLDADGVPQRVHGPAVDEPARLTGGSVIFGPGTIRYPDELGGTAGPTAVSAAAMLAGALTGRLATTTGTEPLYLRRPDATLPPAVPVVTG